MWLNIKGLITRLWTSQSHSATSAMRMLEGCLKLVTRLRAVCLVKSTTDPVMVFDIVNAGPRHRFATIDGKILHNCLGLQFGMGVEKLQRKLTVDCGREVSMKEAAKQVALHKRIYKVYWRWSKQVGKTYERKGFLMLKDGFALNGNCNRMTSVRNFPVQGTGAVILRLATVKAIEKGVPVISPLHDALYACCPTAEKDRWTRELSAAMTEACLEILDFDVRQDIEYHDDTHPWVEGRGKAVYGALAPFYEEVITEEETRLQQLEDFYATL